MAFFLGLLLCILLLAFLAFPMAAMDVVGNFGGRFSGTSSSKSSDSSSSGSSVTSPRARELRVRFPALSHPFDCLEFNFIYSLGFPCAGASDGAGSSGGSQNGTYKAGPSQPAEPLLPALEVRVEEEEEKEEERKEEKKKKKKEEEEEEEDKKKKKARTEVDLSSLPWPHAFSLLPWSSRQMGYYPWNRPSSSDDGLEYYNYVSDQSI